MIEATDERNDEAVHHRGASAVRRAAVAVFAKPTRHIRPKSLIVWWD
ncbi:MULTISPECIES: hypothetical protein [unclassified Streptomyces]